jgi:hypothetical protein
VLKLILLPVTTQNMLLPAVDQDTAVQPNKSGLVMPKNIFVPTLQTTT